MNMNIEKISRHAEEKIADLLGISVDDFWGILDRANDPEDQGVRWINRVDHQPDRHRLYIEESSKMLVLAIQNGVLVTVMCLPFRGRVTPASEEQRFKTLSRILRDKGLPSMDWSRFQEFEARLRDLLLVREHKKKYRVRRGTCRFPVEGTGRKFYVLYRIENKTIIGPVYPTRGVKLDHASEPIFIY